MRWKRAVVAVGVVVVDAGVAVITNLVTGGSGWWAWLVFGVLVAVSGGLAWWRQTQSQPRRPSTELLTEAKDGVVEDSPIDTPVSGDVRMTIRATRKGRVSRSPQTGR